MMRLAIAGFLILSLVACNGAGSVPGTPVTGADVHRAIGSHGTIGGVIKTDAFVVKPHTSIAVVRDLVLFASSSVDIEGRLYVPPGRSVTIFTPSFRLHTGAYIDGTSDTTGPLGTIAVSACNIDVAGYLLVPSSVNLQFTAEPKPPKGQHCIVVIEKSATIILFPGYSGGEEPNGPNGRDGGSLEIGAHDAVAYADSIARKNGEVIAAFAPDVINTMKPLKAGDGGKGQDAPTGSLLSGAFAFRAGNGGNGGSVNIDVGRIIGTDVQIEAGNGGNGGTIGASTTYFPGPMDGTATAPNALPAAIYMGSGGAGGSITVDAKKPFDTLVRAGNGGNASAITSATQANWFGAGCGFPCGSFGVTPGTPVTGNGGSLTIAFALPGNKGSGGNSSAPIDGQFPAFSLTGGGGSSVSLLTCCAAGQEVQGGNGGDLTFVLPAGAMPNTLTQTYGLKISFAFFGYGGSSVLDNYPPCPPGIAGGNGGNFHDAGLRALLIPINGNAYGFDGGNGSFGNPPGAGGKPGIDDEGQQIGEPGYTGTYNCMNAAAIRLPRGSSRGAQR